MHITADNVFDNAFERLKLDDDSGFHPRKGFEHTRGSENWDFYVVTAALFLGSTHTGAASMPHHSTPSHSLVSHPKSEVSMPLTSTPTRKPTHTPHTSTSAPSTPTRPRKALYVYSRGQDTTIFADHNAGNTPLLLTYSKRKKAKNTFSLGTFGYNNLHASSSTSTSAGARTGNLTADGRRAAVRSLPIQWERDNPPIPDAADDTDWLDLPDESFGTDPDTGHQRKRKRKWMTLFAIGWPIIAMNTCGCLSPGRDSWARNLAAPAASPAYTAAASAPVPRFSVVNAWNGSFFDRRELRQLGLRVQLGHADSRRCPHAQPGRHKFVVIAPNGFHHVSVDFCQCRLGGGQPHWEQLLSYGWFPATPDNPQSAITIAALKLFHAVSLQGKTTVYHFFNALAKITDNTGSKAFKRRYPLALRVVRQWRNLRALKRGGMGNDPDRRTAETHQGELAVDCLACPKAGVNLPEGWKDAPVELRYLYTIFLAIDACFRLKRKKISSWLKDPSLQDGWSYFVRSFTYEEFVKTLGEQKEMSTCTGLAALDHANTKYAQGYAATGCGMITCGRHEIVCKNGVGDLQAGENSAKTSFRCSISWALRKLTWEGIERIWSSSGLMGESTREMGPGSRQDTLDDFWHHWNWGKVVGMGTTLRKRPAPGKERARAGNGTPSRSLRWHSRVRSLPGRRRSTTLRPGASTTNPYQLPHAGPTLKDIELELTREEQEREQGSSVVPEADEDTMIEYLMLGLEIEGQQYVIGGQLAADPTGQKIPHHQGTYGFRYAAHTDFPPNQEAAANAAQREFRGRPAWPNCQEKAPDLQTLNSRRQHQNTRSRSLVDGQQRKVDLAAATYRQARLARLALLARAREGGSRLPRTRGGQEEEAARHEKQRKEARQVNENGENRLTSWIWFGAGNTEGAVGEAMHEGVRVEWSKAYARVKRWREEERLLQEEMARCLLTLEWQAAEWDQRTTPEHYSGKSRYGAAHMQGAMVFAARQAAVRRQLATRFRRSWWRLSDRVGGGEPPASSESSGVDERDGPSGGEDSDDDGGWEDEGISAQEPAVSDGNNEGGPEEEEKEDESEDESEDEEEDVARREAEMDELLAIQTTSLAQYDEL
ncbi:hypothetical protein B0H14DRAFT_2572191 [Mycena olivaceomarginata]|nr:hypothetical protein B0H14DRAFT_2572191 [Mycena olivaceomarginata]